MSGRVRFCLFACLLAKGSGNPLAQQAPPPPAAAGQEHDHGAHTTGSQQPVTPVPSLSDADRTAAFPDLEGHTTHDSAVYSFVLFDQLEWQKGAGQSTISWDNVSWFGRDVHRLWFRTEGESERRQVHKAE